MHQQSSIFDEAVASLNTQERIEMLRRISSETDYKEDVVLCDTQEEYIIGSEQLVEFKASLTFREKIVLFISTYIFREDPDRCLELILLKKTKKEILRKYSVYVDFGAKKFLPALKKQLEELNIALDVFRRPLLDALGEHRKDFYAFLGSEEIPVIQKRLDYETDPNQILHRQPHIDNAILKTTIMRNCSNILGEITKDQKDSITALVRILVNLERLSSFNFNKCLALFSKDETCPFELLGKLLEKLNDISYALTVSPPTRLLQCLFIFSYQVQHLSPPEGLGTRLKHDFGLAADAMVLVVEFNRFPLTKLIKILKENYFYNPNLLSGGEDWSLLYKKFWKSRIELSYRLFTSKRKLETLCAKACSLLGIKHFPVVACYTHKNWPGESGPSCPLAFAITYEFYRSVHDNLMEIVLQPILNEGNFYRKTEKTKLLESMDFFVKISVEIRSFIETLDPKAEIGQQLADNAIDSKKLEAITSIASRNAISFVQNSIEVLRTVALVLRTIYDDGFNEQRCPISNMSDLYIKDEKLEGELFYYAGLLLELWTLIADIRDVEDRFAHMGSVYNTKAPLSMKMKTASEEI